MRRFASGWLGVLAVSAVFGAGCIGGKSEATPTRSASEKVGGSSDLHRPLAIPTMAPGAACPRTPGGRPSPDVAIALGSGPAYPVLGFEGERVPPDPKALVPLYPEDRKGAAYWHKTLWAVDRSYDGPILIRGWAILAGRPLWFGDPSFTGEGKQGRVPELRMPAERSNSWRYGPSLTILPGPGCYAFQVDGKNFSKVIVFEAARVSTV